MHISTKNRAHLVPQAYAEFIPYGAPYFRRVHLLGAKLRLKLEAHGGERDI